ncbi:MAG: DNA polymerase III subunit gamma/tau [Muribaculaceae bacterium]|nr:DNA polymerase III subunit gamma/tau [Muribaculaceae bacterium]
MENKYIVSARKYRPATFASVVGQKALTVTLKNSIAQDRLAHAYLFCGSRGVGKTSCARIFAKTINCENRTADGEACNECPSCRDFNEGRSLNIIELDAASNNGVDDIRALTDQVQVPPSSGRYRVFIVDEVHMLSTAAFNAFLKTLEEPPSYVIFILATTEKHKVIPTILSRCQIYDFNRITIADMVEHLSYVASQEGITAEPAALNVIARKADGAMRDALSIFDQVAASSMNAITYQSTIDSLNVLDSEYYNRLLEAFLNGNVPDALIIYKEIRDHGFNNHFFLTGLADYFRDLMVAADPKTLELLEADAEHRARMAALAARCTPQFLYRAMDLCNTADLNYREAANKQFLVELTLIKLCQADGPSPNNDEVGYGEGQELQPIVAMEPTVEMKAAPPPPVSAARHSSVAQQPDHNTPTRPAPAVPSPAPAPVSRRAPQIANLSGLGPGVSIKAPLRNLSDTKSAASAAASRRPDAQVRTASYTGNAVDVAWENYIQSNPSAQSLIATMRSCRPKHMQDHMFIVAVESPAQQQTLESNIGNIRRYMRDKLANDLVDFTIEVVEGEGSPRTWTARQVYEKMLADHPALKTLAEELKLTME